MWDHARPRPTRSVSKDELESLDCPLERMDSLEDNLLSPTSRSRNARLDSSA